MKRIALIHLTSGVAHAVSLHSYPSAPANEQSNERQRAECVEYVNDIFRLLQDNNAELPGNLTPDILVKRLDPDADKAIIGALIYQHLRPGDKDRLLAFTLGDRYPDGNVLIRHTFADKNADDCLLRPQNLPMDSRKQFMLFAHRLKDIGLIAEEQHPDDGAFEIKHAGMVNLSDQHLENSRIEPLDHHLIAQPSVRGALWIDSLPTQNGKLFADNLFSLVKQAAARENHLENDFRNAAQEHPSLTAVRNWIEENQIKSKTHGDVYAYIFNQLQSARITSTGFNNNGAPYPNGNEGTPAP